MHIGLIGGIGPAATDFYYRRLVAAGADCVVVTSIAGHFCINAFTADSPLPVVNMISEVSRTVAARGLKRPGILGARTVMESRFYGGITTAEIIPPDGPELDVVNRPTLTWRRSAQ